MQHQTSVTRVLGRQRFQTIPQRRVVCPLGSVTHDRTMGSDQSTGPPLTHDSDLYQVVHSAAAFDGPYQFFESSSFSAALSRWASASNCFSFRFSPSSSLSFLASEICMPPYLDRHR